MREQDKKHLEQQAKQAGLLVIAHPPDPDIPWDHAKHIMSRVIRGDGWKEYVEASAFLNGYILATLRCNAVRT